MVNQTKKKHDKIIKLQAFDSKCFRGNSNLEEDNTQNYLVFQPMYRYFKNIIDVCSVDFIYFSKSKGLSDENIRPPIKFDYTLSPKLSYFGTKMIAEFNGSCLKQDKITYTHGKLVNISIIYEISKSVPISYYLTLEICLFGQLN